MKNAPLKKFSAPWQTKRLGDIARLYQPETIAQTLFKTSGYPVYGANGVIGFYDFYNHTTPQIMISCRGNCGTVNRSDGPAWITGNAMVVNIDEMGGEIDSNFLYFLLSSIDYSLITTGSGQPQITKEMLDKISLRFPTEKEEQVAIGSILSDVEESILSTSRLIEKKKSMRQAIISEFLCGKIKTKTFSRPWNKFPLSSLIKHHSGNSKLIKGDLNHSNLQGMFPAYSASGQDVWHSKFDHEGDAIIVSAVGSRCGKAFLAKGRWSAIANTHVVWADSNKIRIEYLFLILNNENFWIKSGTGQPFVLFNQTFRRYIQIPSTREQIYIARIIADFDDEIVALENLVKKRRMLRQAVMGELLTDRVRLPIKLVPSDDGGFHV